MANNNDNTPQKEELVSVKAEQDATASPSESSNKTQQKKASGNGLLWFVVFVLFSIKTCFKQPLKRLTKTV